MEILIKLASKYRPLIFDDMIGQEAVVKVLKAVVKKRVFSCAYLFKGPRGVGKTTAARIFSNAILCQSPKDGNPCLSCEPCLLFAKEQHFSFRELDAASFSGKEDMKRLREDATYTSVSEKKIILLDESHDITTAGQDVLLKQVEQAPPHLIFMFCTTDPDKMAKTLKDRCMEFQVSKVDEIQIVPRLKFVCEQEKLKFQDDALVLIAERSGGHVRNALNILEELAYLDEISVSNLNLIYKDYEEEIFTVVQNLGHDLLKVIETYKSISSSLSVSQFYRSMVSLVNDAAKYLYGYKNFSDKRLNHIKKLTAIHGYSLFEFLTYLIQRNKYLDKINLQSDLVILHYKYSVNSFTVSPTAKSVKSVVSVEEPSKVSVEEPSKVSVEEPSKKESEKTARPLMFSELRKLNISDRNKLLREQRMTQKSEHKEEKENVAISWPLPKEEKVGEDSLSEKVFSAQEFSQGLIGGRQSEKKIVD